MMERCVEETNREFPFSKIDVDFGVGVVQPMKEVPHIADRLHHECPRSVGLWWRVWRCRKPEIKHRGEGVLHEHFYFGVDMLVIIHNLSGLQENNVSGRAAIEPRQLFTDPFRRLRSDLGDHLAADRTSENRVTHHFTQRLPQASAALQALVQSKHRRPGGFHVCLSHSGACAAQ